MLDDNLGFEVFNLDLDDHGEWNLDDLEDWCLNDLSHIFKNSLGVGLDALSDVRHLDFDLHKDDFDILVLDVNEFLVSFQEGNIDDGIVCSRLESGVLDLLVYKEDLSSWD